MLTLNLIVQKGLDQGGGTARAFHRASIIRADWIIAEDGAFALAIQTGNEIVDVVGEEAANLFKLFKVFVFLNSPIVQHRRQHGGNGRR